MGRAKGTPKTGGRKAGTPNKATGTLKEFVNNLIDQNRGQIEKDLKALKPRDRLVMMEKLMQYVIPKEQAVKAGIEIDALTDTQISVVAKSMLKQIEP